MQILYNLFIAIILLFHTDILATMFDPAYSSFHKADFIEYTSDNKLLYSRNNQILFNDYFVRANEIWIDNANNIFLADGNIRITDKKNKIIFGDRATFKTDLKYGLISNFALGYGKTNIATARLAEKIDDNKLLLHNASFTPCTLECTTNPIWHITAKKTKIDFTENNITYHHAFFLLHGIPILYSPYLSHPTSNASAKSGILTPSINNRTITLPIYWRAAANLDFTFTPKIFQKNYNIFELEARYKYNKNNNRFTLSYGKVPYIITKNDNESINKKRNSRHYTAQSDFTNENYNFGFKLERASDAAYLKNYYNRYDPYLVSQLYFYNVNRENYFSIEAMNFQGLRDADSKNTDPLVLPAIKLKKLIYLDAQETISMTIKNQSLIYKELSGKELGRTALDFTLATNIITDSGYVLKMTGSNRSDLYFVKNFNYSIGSKKINDGYRTDDDKLLFRNIPEFETTLSYPVYQIFNERNTILLEPIITAIIGRNETKYDRCFHLIDSPKYELSENNLFLSNRYTGLDHHEFGKRLSYGINSAIMHDHGYLGFFLAKSHNSSSNLYKNDVANIENVGNISASFLNIVELYYRFRKTNNFNIIRDEFGVKIVGDRLKLNTSLITIKNLKKYYTGWSVDNSDVNDITQSYFDISYNLTDNWTIGYETVFDLSKAKPDLFMNKATLSYNKDCISVSFGIYNNFMSDSSRAIKQYLAVPTISIGLRTLNM